MRFSRAYTLAAAFSCVLFISACDSSEDSTSTGWVEWRKIAASDEAIAAASKALDANGFTGYQPTGEVNAKLIELKTLKEKLPRYEIIFSDGNNVVEVDVEAAGNQVVEIEEGIQQSDIPENVKKAAAAKANDLSDCDFFQAFHMWGNQVVETWYEFDDCDGGNLDIEVRANDLKVVTKYPNRPLN